MDIWDCIDDSREDDRNDEIDFRNTELLSSVNSLRECSKTLTKLISKVPHMSEKELEIEYELEVERAYGIPYGKYINRMDTKFFDSDEYRQVFQLLTPDIELNECIYKYSKQSILDNWGTDKESMFLIDADSKELIASIERNEDKIDLGVTYTQEFRDALDEAIQRGVRIVAIHNHPNGYPPSLDDISKVVENHYEEAIVAGSNGLVYRYHNDSKRIFTKDECKDCHQLIAFNVEAGFDIDRAYRDVYGTLGVSYEIIEGGKENG